MHSGPSEEWELITGNQVRFRRDLIEICPLGRRKGTHILRKLAFYSEEMLFFSFISLFFTHSAMYLHSPCSVRLCAEEKLAQEVSSPALFSCSVCLMLKGWTWLEQFVHLVSVWALSAGEIFSFAWLQRGLAAETKLGFYPLILFLLLFFFFFTSQKGKTDFFPNALSFLLLFVFQIHFVEVHTFIWG